jgi:hypothetical protein
MEFMILNQKHIYIKILKHHLAIHIFKKDIAHMDTDANIFIVSYNIYLNITNICFKFIMKNNYQQLYYKNNKNNNFSINYKFKITLIISSI